jgi:hypothetical protein
MAPAANNAKPNQPNVHDYDALYQPTFIDVTSSRYNNVGFCLIGISVVIMILQAFGVQPAWVWKRADDVTTILFTIELGIRLFEKGYLFFTEEAEKSWNFFDTLVVAISLFSMIMAAKAAEAESHGGGTDHSAAMQKMKALRTLRLLRLFRLFRFCKGIDKVNNAVDLFLNGILAIFITLIVVAAFTALIITMVVALWAGGKAWLRDHALPELPKID